MSGSYSVEIDAARNLIRVALSGFFTSADIAGFVAAQRAAIRRLQCGPNRHVTVVDLRAIKIQSQDSVTAFRRVLADPATRSRRLAFVVSPSLARTQLLRALDHREAPSFADVASAEAWVLAEDRAAAKSGSKPWHHLLAWNGVRSNI